MGNDDTDPTGANSAAIDASVVERVAKTHDVDPGELAAVVTVVGADLTDAHHEYELAYDHATVDDTRVYAVPDEEWEAVIDRNDAADVAAPLREAHREQAAELVDTPPETPLIAGIDTAEEPDHIPQQYEE